MDQSLLLSRLGRQILEARKNHGLTQARVAELSGLPRQKVIAVEQGASTVAMVAYARVLCALDCELSVIPAALPTLEELGELFE
ncbi:helix-turn-helix transcriptional regulator [Pseudomonas sp. KB_15]|uniref:helix-turn-helix transcriptional regulator n=1 Tax=Pseudomonas sp. KB_15 TaxID=3233035 RepID=UPI003F962724